MVNRDYSPSGTEEDVLDVLREEWRANPYLIREQTEHGKGAINTALTRLTSAGWVRKVTRGLYEFVEDPRRDSGEMDSGEIQGDIETSLDGTDATEAVESHDDPEPVDPIEKALSGWSYGRTAEEQEANHSVARKSLEWLRDEGGEEVKQEDVPLGELEEDDPEGRKADTLWRSVVRGAWQHAAGQGYVAQPHSRAYRWVGQKE